jgi:hypothetical protein
MLERRLSEQERHEVTTPLVESINVFNDETLDSFFSLDPTILSLTADELSATVSPTDSPTAFVLSDHLRLDLYVKKP